MMNPNRFENSAIQLILIDKTDSQEFVNPRKKETSLSRLSLTSLPFRFSASRAGVIF